MCGTGGGNKSGGAKSGGNKGGGHPSAVAPVKKASIFTPTKKSIAKNKIAGAKHTAAQRAKGIGVARSNITSSNGKAIKGVANSETNPALVKLAKRGLSGAAGLKELSRQQAATLDKDTSFSGIWKSIKSGEKHEPVQSLLEFGKANEYRKGSGHPSALAKPTETQTSTSSVSSKPNIKIATSPSSGANQGTAPSSGGPAGASVQPSNLKNMLAIKKNKQSQGKRGTRTKRGGGIAVGAGGVGLNITT